jgi:hypothetical protein
MTNLNAPLLAMPRRQRDGRSASSAPHQPAHLSSENRGCGQQNENLKPHRQSPKVPEPAPDDRNSPTARKHGGVSSLSFLPTPGQVPASLPGMSTRPRSQAGPPMTLGNMRANGVRSLDVCCWQCHHRTILSADPWPDRAWSAPGAASSVPTPGRTGGRSRCWRRWHTMRRSDQQCGPKSDRQTGMPLARSRGALQVPVGRT